MEAGIRIPSPSAADSGSGWEQLFAEWRRLGIDGYAECLVETHSSGACMRLRLVEHRSREWMPDHDTLGLAETIKLHVSFREDDLLCEIWLTLLNCPLPLEYPSAEELLAVVRIRRNIAVNAARTCLNFDTSAIERPADCWCYSEETGFVLIPGSPLIASLKKACQPKAGGGRLFSNGLAMLDEHDFEMLGEQLYSFSCYRATEYVILLSIAEEAQASHPELLQLLQAQWEKKAISSCQFHDVFMDELGTLEEPLPLHYYVPGDRVWFRNPDPHSSDVPGFEGSWVFYLGGGLFANFWKCNKPFNLLTKCVEIHHWRDGVYKDEHGALQMDEAKVEQLVAQTLKSPELTSRVFERMHRLRDGQGIYAEGGCMDATREAPKFVLPPHTELIRVLKAL